MWGDINGRSNKFNQKTSPSNYHYICEKNGGSLFDKVKYPNQMTWQAAC